MRVPIVGLACFACAACGSLEGDKPSESNPNPMGSGLRISQVTNPGSPEHPKSNASVAITGADVTWLDTFDETKDGKSRGTLYVQDVGSSAPYSGVGVYSPSYVPSDLRVAPGDIIDFTGPYQELANIGSAVFPKNQVLPQLAKPVGMFRYEFQAVTPTKITWTDLNDYAKGRQWESMLVEVDDVYVAAATLDSSGYRVTYPIVPTPNAGPVPSAVAVSNELYDLKQDDFKAGTHFSKVTGIVTWFFSYHIAPRNSADLVQ